MILGIIYEIITTFFGTNRSVNNPKDQAEKAVLDGL
jgi:hypothetical protein